MVIKEEEVMVNIVLEDKVVRFREIVRVDARKDSFSSDSQAGLSVT
jgi:hypothetical protein